MVVMALGKTHSTDWNPDTRQVAVIPDLALERLCALIPKKDWEYIGHLALRFCGKRMVFIGSALETDVARIREPLIALLQLLGVYADWYALAPNPEALNATRRPFGDMVQDAPEAVRLTNDGKDIYRTWIAAEAKALKLPLARADIVVLDGWQASGLIPHIRESRQYCTVIVRDHSYTKGRLMAARNTPQNSTWRFLWGPKGNRICDVDAFVAHPPYDGSIPPDVPRRKVALMETTINGRPATSSSAIGWLSLGIVASSSPFEGGGQWAESIVVQGLVRPQL